MTSKAHYTLSMDPGLRQCGLGLYEGPTLVRAWLAKNPSKRDRGPQAWQKMAEAVMESWLVRSRKPVTNFVVEIPQIYWGKRGGGRAADLIELAGVVGAVAATIPAAARQHYLPRTWKGTVPKDVHNRRTLKRLSEDELAVIEPCQPSLQNNVTDGIGLGLFFLGRT